MPKLKDLTAAVESGSADAVRAVLAAGVKPDGMDGATGESPLTTAAEAGNAAVVRALLEAGADPNYKRTVTPPLVAAAGGGHLEIVELLLAAGAEVDARDEGGGTALMDAAAAGHVDVVKRLLAAGADPKAKDRERTSAVEYAAEKGHREVVELLAPLSTPAMREQALRTLRFAEHQPHPRTKELMDVIHSPKWKGLRGELADVKRLVEEGVPFDDPDASGMTPLMLAANAGRLDIVECLVGLGADVNRQDVYGHPPLTYAAMTGWSAVYDYLYSLTDPKLHKGAERDKKVHVHNGTWK